MRQHRCAKLAGSPRRAEITYTSPQAPPPARLRDEMGADVAQARGSESSEVSRAPEPGSKLCPAV